MATKKEEHVEVLNTTPTPYVATAMRGDKPTRVYLQPGKNTSKGPVRHVQPAATIVEKSLWDAVKPRLSHLVDKGLLRVAPVSAQQVEAAAG